MTFGDWLRPPTLRSDDVDGQRQAMWLELFFYLVFVVAVAELVQAPAGEPKVGGVVSIVILFVGLLALSCPVQIGDNLQIRKPKVAKDAPAVTDLLQGWPLADADGTTTVLRVG